MCARKKQTLLFDLSKAFDEFEGRIGLFLSEKTYFPSRVRSSELPSNESPMVRPMYWFISFRSAFWD